MVGLGWERFCLGDPCSCTGCVLRVHGAVFLVTGRWQLYGYSFSECPGADVQSCVPVLHFSSFHFFFFKNFPKVYVVIVVGFLYCGIAMITTLTICKWKRNRKCVVYFFTFFYV